jgi:hypothetical protein
MSYANNPEVIGVVATVAGRKESGEQNAVVGLSVQVGNSRYPGGQLMIDVQEAHGFDNITVTLDAEQFMQAVSRALMNRDKVTA